MTLLRRKRVLAGRLAAQTGRRAGERGRSRGALKAFVLAVVLVALPVVPSMPGDRSEGVVADSAREAGEPADGPRPAGVLPPGESWTVTLLTGDVVDVRSDAEGRVTAAVRRPQRGFRTLSHPDGALYVVPYAATHMLVDVLDPELFNVTGLIQQGYDDASRDSIGLIVQREAGSEVPEVFGATEEQTLPSIGAVALEVPKAGTAAVGDEILSAGSGDTVDPLAGAGQVWLDRRMTALSADTAAAAAAGRRDQVPPARADAGELDGNLTQIGADRAWAAGLSGEGVEVAVLDTGIDADHPDLAGEVVAERNFSVSDSPDDRLGHGTHVAAIAAGTGAGASGQRSGVAPDAELLNAKVLDDEGFGMESDIIAGMEWAAPQSDVVTMSLGGPSPDPAEAPMAQAVDRLTETHGTLFVVAAGNSGPVSSSVDSPGIASRALTVGAVDGDDRLADFSSRGPVPGSYALKPEVVAPGVDVVAARAEGTSLGDPIDARYTSLSGTSMATPHVAGAAAILAEQHPGWDADDLKTALVGSTDEVEGDGYDVGSGRLDVGDGIGTSVLADRDVAHAVLPQPTTEPHQEILTWTNVGDSEETLELDVELYDRQATPQQAVSVAPAEMTVAPGETGSARLTVDGPELEPGLYSGTVTASATTVTASSGDTEDRQATARLPLAVRVEPEQVELTVAATPPVESPAGTPGGLAAVVNLDDAAEFLRFFYYEGSGFDVTVPVGRYSVIGDVTTGDVDMDIAAQVGDPDVTLTEDTTVAFDGSAAGPLDPTVEGVDTAPPVHSGSALISTPAVGTDGRPVIMDAFALYPSPPLRMTPMRADPDVFAASHLYRLQEPHLTARTSGGQPLDITGVGRWAPDPGEHQLTAFDAGDGSDFTGAAGTLAVVRLPADPFARVGITARAVEAEVALLALVDEQRPHLTVFAFGFPDPSELSVIAAAGQGASDLLTAAAAGDQVTVTVTGSPYVYDIASPRAGEVTPDPVIDEAEQARLATLHERFHRDAEGSEPSGDARYLTPDLDSIVYGGIPVSPAVYSEGPLPEERTAYVSAGVEWTNFVYGTGHFAGAPISNILLSGDSQERFEPGEERTVSWLRRPQWPGPVGGPQGLSACQPRPVTRDLETLHVWLAPFQDGLDRYGCSQPLSATLTLGRDGEPVESVSSNRADFAVPPDRESYSLTYEQEGESPYDHRSHTTWTFDSAAPDEAGAGEPIPLIVVDYDLPLDTLNRPTGREATLSLQHVTGSEQGFIIPPRVWTSTDGGQRWRRAPVRWDGWGTYRVSLPHAEEGTSISLRVSARDLAGNGIDQILYDAYTS